MMQRSQEASDLPSVGCCSAFSALLSIARGFIRQHAAWSRSSVMEDVSDHSFRPSNTGSGLEGSEPVAASVRSGQGGVLMRLPVGSLKPLQPPKALEHVYLEDEGRLGNCRSDDEGDPNLKALSKRKKEGKSRMINQSLDNEEHGSLENDDRICDSRSYNEGDPNLKMPSKMKTHESIESDGSLNKKDEHVSSEIDGKLGNNRINDEGQSKMKVPCWIKKIHESGKRNENLDKKDQHVSSENEDRPKAVEVLHHPLFWNSKMRLSFLRDVSDWVESKTRRTNPDLLEKLERIAWCVFDEEWYGKIDHKVIKHMRRFRAYKFKRVRDLLRIVRNMFSHSIGLPPKIQLNLGKAYRVNVSASSSVGFVAHIQYCSDGWLWQEIVGSSPEDLDSYIAKRFPRLLIETYRFISMCCKDEERSPFLEYFNC
ncbi:hypothetical protein NL676_006503 [Syzygium grande]|nr:hypothetical protein NL676_006503 [Syzygium grande]